MKALSCQVLQGIIIIPNGSSADGSVIEEVVISWGTSCWSACPGNDHRAWTDIMLEEMKAFLGLAVNMSLTCERVLVIEPFSGFSFFESKRVPWHTALSPLPCIGRFCTQLKNDLYLVQHLNQQYQRVYLSEREICVDESIAGYQSRTPATKLLGKQSPPSFGVCSCGNSVYTWNSTRRCWWCCGWDYHW